MSAQRLLGAAAREEQRAVEASPHRPRRPAHEHLLDARHRALARARRRRERRSGTTRQPATATRSRLQLRRRSVVARARGVGLVVRQEHQAGGVARRAERDAGFARQRAQERVGLADQQAAAVAAEAVGGDAAAVGHAGERFQRGVHQCALASSTLAAAAHARDQAEAAAVVFIAGVVQPAIRNVPHRRSPVGWGTATAATLPPCGACCGASLRRLEHSLCSAATPRPRSGAQLRRRCGRRGCGSGAASPEVSPLQPRRRCWRAGRVERTACAGGGCAGEVGAGRHDSGPPKAAHSAITVGCALTRTATPSCAPVIQRGTRAVVGHDPGVAGRASDASTASRRSGGSACQSSRPSI